MEKIAEKNKKRYNRRLGECSYHLCDKKRVELYKCKHCEKYFCKEHMNVKIPQMAPFKSTDVDRHIEWEKKGGHPCLPYLDYVIKKEKEQKLAMFSKPYPIIVEQVAKPDINIDEIERFNDIKKEGDTSDDSIEDWLQEKQKEMVGESEPKVSEPEPEIATPKEEVRTCFECGEQVGYLGERFITDRNTGKKIRLCPECYSKKTEKTKRIEHERLHKTVKKSGTQSTILHKISAGILVTVLIVCIWFCYSNANDINSRLSNMESINDKLSSVETELNEAMVELNSAENNFQSLKNELSSVENQISSTESNLNNVDAELSYMKSGKRYELHDPTYSEVINFLSKDKTDKNEYTSSYTCNYFSKDVNNNAEAQGIRCAYVVLEYLDVGHAIVAFDTTDRGLVYFEPQHDVRANIQAGYRYYKCLAQLPGYLPWPAPDFDDTILGISRYW